MGRALDNRLSRLNDKIEAVHAAARVQRSVAEQVRRREIFQEAITTKWAADIVEMQASIRTINMQLQKPFLAVTFVSHKQALSGAMHDAVTISVMMEDELPRAVKIDVFPDGHTTFFYEDPNGSRDVSTNLNVFEAISNDYDQVIVRFLELQIA